LYTETVNTETGEIVNMSESVLSLLDIPDLSAVEDQRPEPLADGWYQGTILAKREFTDNNGNERVFESSDTPAQRSGRNIRLQVELKRWSDGRTFNLSTLINYKPEDLTAEVVQAVAKARQENKENGTEFGPGLFRSFMTLTRLAKLQKIAGVRQFHRSDDGGLDLTPLFGKTAYFRIQPDKRSEGKYKEIGDFQDYEPKRVPVQ